MESSSEKADSKESKKLYTGGTSCGVILEKENAIVLGVDLKQVYYVRGASPVAPDLPVDGKPKPKWMNLKNRFVVTGVGLRRYVQQWLGDLYYKINDGDSIQTCIETLEAYRLNNFANKGKIDTVEVLLAGWDETNKVVLYYFHNGGYTQIKDAYCTGKGANTAWMALVNKGIKTWTVDYTVRSVQRAVYDASLYDATTGEGVDVLVLYPGEKPDRDKYPHVTKDDLERDFGAKSTYMQTLNAGVGTSNTMDLDDHKIGTTTAGFVLDNGHIFLGGDKEKGNPLGETKATIKVFPLGEEFQLPQGYTRAGFQKEVKFMRDQLDAYVKEHKHSSDISQMPDYVLRKVLESNEISNNHRGHILLGGYNKGSNKPHLYYISSAGVLDLTKTGDIQELHNRFQTGSGAGAAFVVLNQRYDPKMSVEAGKILIQDAIYNAIKHDKHTGVGIEYIIISPDGVAKKEMITVEEYEKNRNII